MTETTPPRKTPAVCRPTIVVLERPIQTVGRRARPWYECGWCPAPRSTSTAAAWDYFQTKVHQQRSRHPGHRGSGGKFSIFAHLGGGPSGQGRRARLGIARALILYRRRTGLRWKKAGFQIHAPPSASIRL